MKYSLWLFSKVAFQPGFQHCNHYCVLVFFRIEFLFVRSLSCDVQIFQGEWFLVFWKDVCSEISQREFSWKPSVPPLLQQSRLTFTSQRQDTQSNICRKKNQDFQLFWLLSRIAMVKYYSVWTHHFYWVSFETYNQNLCFSMSGQCTELGNIHGAVAKANFTFFLYTCIYACIYTCLHARSYCTSAYAHAYAHL